MPDSAAQQKVRQKAALLQELRGILAFVVVFIMTGAIAATMFLAWQVLNLTSELNNSNIERHNDTVNVITAAAYCARKPNIHTYDQMVTCIALLIRPPRS